MKHGRHRFLNLSVLFLIYSILAVCAKHLKSNAIDSLKINSNLNANAAGSFDRNNVENLSVVSPPTKLTLEEGSNCTPPAIEQFPRPFMTKWTRIHGGIIVYILIAAYAFIALAIVCDDYFVASLSRICEDLKLTPDVAGATFMAAGSSAPELATVIIGVFCAKDDIGVSGVIGSAVFNIMFVISVSALATKAACYLNWWPLVRDCLFYAVSVLVMLYTIFDETVTWKESLLMIFLYCVYCTVLSFNSQLQKLSQIIIGSNKQDTPNEKCELIDHDTSSLYDNNLNKTEDKEKGDYESANHVCNGKELHAPSLNLQEHNKPENSTDVDHLQKPGTNIWAQILQFIIMPIYCISMLTMPDCRSEQCRKWYPLTFIISMLWISVYSYIMVWMITIIGTTLGIPDTVMGLTFVAAGVSVPDALASVAVIKEGYGDMAVSNAIGSNVFDILFCLGVPWFIQTAIVEPGSHVNVRSKGLTYSTISLLSTIIFLLVATHLNGWKLDKKFGIILMIWYLLFISLASLYELNVFGLLNPPACPSSY